MKYAALLQIFLSGNAPSAYIKSLEWQTGATQDKWVGKVSVVKINRSRISSVTGTLLVVVIATLGLINDAVASVVTLEKTLQQYLPDSAFKCARFGEVDRQGTVTLREACPGETPALKNLGTFDVGGHYLKKNSGSSILLFYPDQQPIWVLGSSSQDLLLADIYHKSGVFLASDPQPAPLLHDVDMDSIQLARLLVAAGGQEMLLNASGWLNSVESRGDFIIDGIASGVVTIGAKMAATLALSVFGLKPMTVVPSVQGHIDRWSQEGIELFLSPVIVEWVFRDVMQNTLKRYLRYLNLEMGHDLPSADRQASIVSRLLVSYVYGHITYSGYPSESGGLGLVHGLYSAASSYFVYGRLYEKYGGISSGVFASITNNLLASLLASYVTNIYNW